MRGFNYKKSTQALNFFCQKEGGTINKMKAIKLIWLADRFHLRNHGRVITGDTYFALPNGPVPSGTRDILEQNSFFLGEDELQYSSSIISMAGQYDYQCKSNVDENIFSKTDLQALDIVYQKYGHLDHFALRDLSHEFPEWKKHESAFNRKVSTRESINIIDFFDDAPNNVDYLKTEPDTKEISKEIFLENAEIANFLK